MQVNCRDFLSVPYIHAWDHAKMAFEPKLVAKSKNHLCTLESDHNPSLVGRIRHLSLAIFLAIPLINVIIHLALKCFFGEKPANNAAVEAPKANPNIPLAPPQIAQDHVYFDEFVEHMSELERTHGNLETAPFYSQFMHNLIKGTPELPNNKKRYIILAPLLKMLTFVSNLQEETKAYAYYRLLNEFTVLTLQDQLNLKDRWDVLVAPGDGNCFLWSCVLSVRMQNSSNPPADFASLSRFGSEHPSYPELSEQMNTLRNTMTTTFMDMIHERGNDDFRAQFIGYIAYNEQVRNHVLRDESDYVKQNFCELGRITEIMIAKYCDFILSNGSWNGEFEAEIVARILQRPIVILRGSTAGSLKLGTIAGADLLEQTEANPIFVRHNGNHYDCLT